MKKLLFALTLVLVLATQSFALKAENVESSLSKLKDIDEAIAWLECIHNPSPQYYAIPHCGCSDRAEKVLEEDGVFKMLLKEIDTLKKRRSSIEVDE